MLHKRIKLLKDIVVLVVKTPLWIISIDLVIVTGTQYCFEFRTCYSFFFSSKSLRPLLKEQMHKITPKVAVIIIQHFQKAVCFNNALNCNLPLGKSLSLRERRGVIDTFISHWKCKCWLSKTHWTLEVVLWSWLLLSCLFWCFHCIVYWEGLRKLEALPLENNFFTRCYNLICLCVCVWHLTPNLSCVVGSTANTEITLMFTTVPKSLGNLWLLLVDVWGMNALSVSVISAFSVIHSLYSHCPSQIPSWRLRSPLLLMPWAAILLSQRWILVEMPWEIWEQKCWQKPYR